MDVRTWLRQDRMRIPRDFALSTGIWIGVVALGATVGAPFALAALAGGVVASVAVYAIEHRIHRTPMTRRGALVAGATGLLAGLFGIVGGPVLGALARPLGVAAEGVVATSVREAGVGIAGALAGGPLGKPEELHSVRERGIGTDLSPYERATSVYGSLPDIERTRRFPFVKVQDPPAPLTVDGLMLMPWYTAETAEPPVPPEGTRNVVVAALLPRTYMDRWGMDFNVSFAPALAEAYHAELIRGDPEKDNALTSDEIARRLRDGNARGKLHDLVIVGHSQTVPSDADRFVCQVTGNVEKCLENLPAWSGLGVAIGAPGHRETLVPGLQTILKEVAQEQGVTVRELFGNGSTIELLDCRVGKNAGWMQDLADLTGARVVAYANDVGAYTPGKHLWRGIDDGAVHPRAEDGRVVFLPRPGAAPRSQGFLARLGSLVK